MFPLFYHTLKGEWTNHRLTQYTKQTLNTQIKVFSVVLSTLLRKHCWLGLQLPTVHKRNTTSGPRPIQVKSVIWGKSSPICRYQRQQLTWWRTVTRTPSTTPSSPRCPPPRILSGRRSSSALCSESSQGSTSSEYSCTDVYMCVQMCTCTSNSRHLCTIVTLKTTKKLPMHSP